MVACPAPVSACSRCSQVWPNLFICHRSHYVKLDWLCIWGGLIDPPEVPKLRELPNLSSRLDTSGGLNGRLGWTDWAPLFFCFMVFCLLFLCVSTLISHKTDQMVVLFVPYQGQWGHKYSFMSFSAINNYTCYTTDDLNYYTDCFNQSCCLWKGRTNRLGTYGPG